MAVSVGVRPRWSGGVDRDLAAVLGCLVPVAQNLSGGGGPPTERRRSSPADSAVTTGRAWRHGPRALRQSRPRSEPSGIGRFGRRARLLVCPLGTADGLRHSVRQSGTGRVRGYCQVLPASNFPLTCAVRRHTAVTPTR